jgi:hypothetical protein
MRVLSDPGGVDGETLAEFAMIDERREAQGLSSDYDRLMTVEPSIVDRSAVRRFEESGITNLLVQPWQNADQRLSVEDKSKLVAEFAENVMA